VLSSADDVIPAALNNKKWVIGYETGQQVQYPILWKHGQLVNLYSLLPAGSSVKLSTLFGINNKDQIIGADGYRATPGYLLTPALAAAPEISNAFPTTIPRGEANVSLTIAGTGFEDDTTVFLKNGLELPTQVLSANKLTVDIPASATSQLSSLEFRLYTPPAGGGYSKFMAVTVVARPVLTSITPARIDPGSAKTPTYFTGMKFAPGDLVTIIDQSNHIYSVAANVASDTKLAIYLPDVVRAAAGLYYLRVGDPSGRILSNPVLLTVGRAAPLISSLSPDRVPVGLTSLSLYVNATGIVTGSKVSFNGGAPVTPTSIQTNRLLVSVPASVLAQVGSYSIRVVNSFADGGTSEPKNFVVAPRPVLTAITPSTFKASTASVTLTLTGANFEAGSVVKINDTTSVTPSFISSTKLTIVLPSAVSSTAGSYFARVFNPGYANNSAPVRFTVTPK
jgi:hypothetical protein